MQTLTQAHSRPCHNNGCTEGDPALFADMLFNCGLWPIPSQPTMCHVQGYNTKLGKLAKKFELVQLLGSKLVESGHIQSVDHFRSDMSQMEQQWCLVRDNVVASYEALTQVGLHEEVGGCLGDMVT